MTQAAPTPISGGVPAPVPLREIAPWAVFGGVALLALLYLVGMDQGVTTLVPGELIHEFVHDGRHLLGFPCH
ncbi:CbtB domain-containing protein [Pseudonocardia sp. HH130630-07]|uniref:CbtB domain-containing protein n=1 Tax=Pseudonocardia sp. HH130630-07 TaxID=1690815 RepID=UPI000815094A|nr:CbtB-domain containing protein [Pseudonocardia sp. HH130630-07]ANY09366.1 cobalt transporter [Pseudonocardia sp. HH130630-07]